MRLLVIGAGAGGAAVVVELHLAGHDVTLYGRSAETVAPFATLGIGHAGVLGTGTLRPALVTNDLAIAMRDAEAAIVALPTFAHAGVARQMAGLGWGATRPVILNPGHTGGALEFRTAWGAGAPPIVEFSTLAYVARKYAPHEVTVTSRARRLRAAALPGGADALALACALFPGVFDTGDVLASDLANVNMVLHPPGAIMAAAWVEARGGDFTFYVDGMTPGVARVMGALDAERRAVARAFGHDLPNLIAEMKQLGTVAADAPEDDLVAAIAGGEANRRIKAPDTLQHRYYREDFGHGLTPFLAFAAIAGVATPMAAALNALAATLTGGIATPRDAQAMGIAGLDRDGLLRLVR
ncbi:NAD/NADP octopine/nopaline dehydrogenase family protein [Humitalea sp. 24SJ18S-53]|uniref:NAD/NADP octopine/nopaline dehydrogenase family protein n=1 Tax=Humitalea sp. 24SJ18S-53 TaxID=3422307 RepID=UPI003D67FCDA